VQEDKLQTIAVGTWKKQRKQMELLKIAGEGRAVYIVLTALP
jgi:hypothetical protein